MMINLLEMTATLLPKYEKRTLQRKLDIAIDMEVSIAGYYRMRNGKGNVGSEAVTRALNVIGRSCPDLVFEYIIAVFYEADRELLFSITGHHFSIDRLMWLLEQKEQEEERYALVLSGNRRND